jgi:hypothetical protein
MRTHVRRSDAPVVTRSQIEYESVQALISQGRSDSEIARLTQIPRSTVRDWRSGLFRSTMRMQEGHARPCRQACEPWTLPPSAYSYLLGMYLGDGCISRSNQVWRLRIFTDAQYPGIIEECSRAMEMVMPGRRTYWLRRPSRCVEISMYSKHWVCLFPQHGPGRKHKRRIRLEPWQTRLVGEATESLLRGLFHSDGCRTIAMDRGRRSVRYQFSNRSEDIKSLFCEALDSLSIPWTRPSDRHIAIYRQAEVARLDRFVGPKR